MCNDCIISTFKLYPYTFFDKLITLNYATISDLPDSTLKNRFKLESNDKSYIFVCNNLQEKQNWMNDIKTKTTLKDSLLMLNDSSSNLTTTLTNNNINNKRKIIMEGYLEKQSRGIRKKFQDWTMRWCVIEENILFYYNSKPSETDSMNIPKSIQLNEFYLNKQPNIITAKTFYFALYNDSRTVYIYNAPNKQQYLLWIKVLEPLTKKKIHSSNSNSNITNSNNNSSSNVTKKPVKVDDLISFD